MLCALGCAGPQVQTQPNEPHGYVRIHIEHTDTPAHLFRDVVAIDGEPMALGSGRGGDLELRLAPGPHSVLFTSTLIAYALEMVEHNDPSGPCVDVRCNMRFPITQHSLELAPHDDKVCQKTSQIEVTSGATQKVTYKTGLPPECDLP